MRQLLTDKELNTKYPHLTLWSINELRRRGQIPFVQIPGMRKYLYDAEKIELWLDNLQQAQPVRR